MLVFTWHLLKHFAECASCHENTNAVSGLPPNMLLRVEDTSVVWQINKLKSVEFLELV